MQLEVKMNGPQVSVSNPIQSNPIVLILQNIAIFLALLFNPSVPHLPLQGYRSCVQPVYQNFSEGDISEKYSHSTYIGVRKILCYGANGECICEFEVPLLYMHIARDSRSSVVLFQGSSCMVNP